MIAVPTRDSLVLGQDFRTDKMLRADRLGGEDLGEDLGEVGQVGGVFPGGDPGEAGGLVADGGQGQLAGGGADRGLGGGIGQGFMRRSRLAAGRRPPGPGPGGRSGPARLSRSPG